MKYLLYRKRDKSGDAGSMSEAIHIVDGEPVVEKNARPQIGKSMRVGSYFAGTYSNQDWWMTTPITEITLDEESRVEFKTGNSEYVWEQF